MRRRSAEKVHARQRAYERYGIEGYAPVRAEIIRKIQGGKSFPGKHTSNRAIIHDVKLDSGMVVRVVYDKSRQELVTFLPLPERERSMYS